MDLDELLSLTAKMNNSMRAICSNGLSNHLEKIADDKKLHDAFRRAMVGSADPDDTLYLYGQMREKGYVFFYHFVDDNILIGRIDQEVSIDGSDKKLLVVDRMDNSTLENGNTFKVNDDILDPQVYDHDILRFMDKKAKKTRQLIDSGSYISENEFGDERVREMMIDYLETGKIPKDHEISSEFFDTVFVYHLANNDLDVRKYMLELSGEHEIVHVKQFEHNNLDGMTSEIEAYLTNLSYSGNKPFILANMVEESENIGALRPIIDGFLSRTKMSLAGLCFLQEDKIEDIANDMLTQKLGCKYEEAYGQFQKLDLNI